jgi:phosphate transport system permease protein
MAATTQEQPLSKGSLLPDSERRQKLRKKRALRDGFSLYGVGAGGIGVIIALGLIFVYLFYETLPLLKPVSVDLGGEFVVPGDVGRAPTMHLTLDRYQEIGARFSADGTITFFNARTGAIQDVLQIPTPEGARVTSFGRAESRRSLFLYGFSDGTCCRS